MSKTMNIGIDHATTPSRPGIFLSQPVSPPIPMNLHPAEHAGVRWKVLRVRDRQTADPAKQDGERELLPADLAAIAKEIQQRGAEPECSVTIAAGLPLAGFGREKKSFREYLRPSSQPVNFKFEGIPYKVTVEDVKLFPQGYSALMIHPELLQNEPSVLLMDIGGWTVDLMRLDNNVPNAATCRSLELG